MYTKNIRESFFIDNNKEINSYSLLICNEKTYGNKLHKKARTVDKITM